MIKSWIFYALWLAAVFMTALLSASSGMFMLMLISLLLPVIIIVIHRFSRYNFDILIDLPDSVEKDITVQGSLKIKNKTWFFCPLIKIIIKGQNVLTGEWRIFEHKCSLLPKRNISAEFKMKESFCGKISFDVIQIKAYDIFGLTYKKSYADIKSSAIVLPDILPLDIIPLSMSGDSLDASDYSSDKPGFDLSEPFEYREYNQGDSPRSIHWKLSQKLDKLIIRQGGLPSPTSAVLILDTCLNKASSPPDFSRLSKTAEIFISLSKRLCDCQIAHTLCFYDHQKEEMFQCMISSDDDWFSVIPKVLSASFIADDKSTLQHYSENITQQFKSVFFITPSEKVWSDYENIDLNVLTADDYQMTD